MSLELNSGIQKCYWDNSSDYIIGYYNVSIWAIDDHGNINDTQYVVVYLGYSSNTNGAPPLVPGYELALLGISLGITIMAITIQLRRK